MVWCCQGERDDVVLTQRKRRCGVVKEKEMMWCCQGERDDVVLSRRKR